MIIGLIIVGLIIDLGALPNQQPIGFNVRLCASSGVCGLIIWLCKVLEESGSLCFPCQSFGA